MQAYFPVDPAQLLRLEGADVADLLHRICATETRDLALGDCRRLLFCDDRGRIVDLPLAVRQADAWYILANEGSAEALADWIGRFVITEDVAFGSIAERPWTLAIDGRSERLCEGPAPEPTAPLSRRDQHWINEGLLRPRRAFARKLHPLECGLRASISFTKGCYIGQEVVARMDSYEKIQRVLHWLRGAGQAPSADAQIRLSDRAVGRILESCQEIGGGYLALAQLAVDADPNALFEVEGAGSGRATRVPDPAN